MSFRFELEKRGSKFANAVTYAVQVSQHHRGPPRHRFLLGGDVMAALGWAVGDIIVVGYGEPGTADFGAVRLLRMKPAKRPRTGVKLRRSSKPGTSSGQLHISFRCEWISEAKHPAVICPWTKACDDADALDVRLPKWAILPAPAALREVAALVARHVAASDNHNPESPADPPPAAEARQATADPLSTAQAGGSDSAGYSAAPPAVNSGSGETSCPQREAASEGMAEQQRDTMGVTAGRGRHLDTEAVSDPPRADTAGGVVGPEVLIAQLSKSERILYDEIVRLCAAGAVMPTLRGLTDLLGLAHSNGVISVLVALEAKDLVRLEGPLGQRVFVNPATGERARPAVTAQPKASDDDAPKPPAPRTQGEIIFALINAAAERGDVSPSYAEMMRAIGKPGSDTTIISACLSVLERRNRIRRYYARPVRVYEIVATGKRTRAAEPPTPDTPAPPPLPKKSEAPSRPAIVPSPASPPIAPRLSAPTHVPSARETEQRLIDEAVARGQVKRLPDPAAIGAALKGEPLIYDMESAKAWLDKHHRKYTKKGGFSYDIAGATVKQSEFVAHVAALQRALAVKSLGKRSA